MAAHAWFTTGCMMFCPSRQQQGVTTLDTLQVCELIWKDATAQAVQERDWRLAVTPHAHAYPPTVYTTPSR